MNNTIQSLQALYVVLDGELTDTYEDIANGIPVSDYTVIPDAIMAITKKATSGGGSGASLPDVTVADNGKLLTVVEGAWNKADAPTELPTVTTDDNGKVLTVSGGKWSKVITHGDRVEELTFSNLSELGDELREAIPYVLNNALNNLSNCKLVIYNAYGVSGLTAILHLSEMQVGQTMIHKFVQDAAFDSTNSKFMNGYTIVLTDESIVGKGYSFDGNGITINNNSIVQGNDTGGCLIY